MSRQHVFKKVCPNNVQFTVRINSSLVKSDRILAKKHQRLPVPTRLHKFLSLRFHSFSQKTSSLIYIFIKKIQKQHNIKIDRITADFNRSIQHGLSPESNYPSRQPCYENVCMRFLMKKSGCLQFSRIFELLYYFCGKIIKKNHLDF